MTLIGGIHSPHIAEVIGVGCVTYYYILQTSKIFKNFLVLIQLCEMAIKFIS